jgi:hypothetical protein
MGDDEVTASLDGFLEHFLSGHHSDGNVFQFDVRITIKKIINSGFFPFNSDRCFQPIDKVSDCHRFILVTIADSVAGISFKLL